MIKGRFIVFEGGEGTGKSTQIKILKAKLESLGKTVVLTWEPGGTNLGQKIRELLIDPQYSPLDPNAEALLFAASRAQHISEKILPALQNGYTVLCDRFIHASLAYQAHARNLGSKFILDINKAIESVKIDRVFLFDLDPVVGLSRVQDRASESDEIIIDRIEQEKLSFHQNVRRSYLQIAKDNPKLFSIIKADGELAEISQLIFTDLSKFYE